MKLTLLTGRLRERAIRLRGTLRPSRRDRELDEELRLHVDLALERERRAGASPAEAARAAAIRAGGVAQAIEAVRDQRRLPWLDDLARDLRHALRLLRRSPGVSLVAMGSLALGIGATTAIFSGFNGLALRTVPVAQPETIVRIRWVGVNEMGTDFDEYGFSGKVGGRPARTTFSYPMFELFRAHNHTLVDLLACAPRSRLTIVVGHRAELATGFVASGNYFDLLGVRAEVGRTFGPFDDRPDAPPVAVVSDGYWRRRFGGHRSIIGSTVEMSGVPVTIVGVTPRAFTGIQQVLSQAPDVTLPLAVVPRFDIRVDGTPLLQLATAWWLQIAGRLKPGVTPEQVRGDLEGTFRAAARDGWASFFATMPSEKQSALEYRDRTHVPDLDVTSAARGIYDVSGDQYRALALLGVVVVLVLLIVCANLANLLLARATARKAEMAVRLSMGATAGRLVRQLLAESLLLASIGGALGVLVAYWGRRLLPADAGPSAPLDGRVLAFAAAASVLTAVVFGLAPALRAARANLTIKEGGRTVGGRTRLGQGLLVGQVALSIVLLVGAGLFLRTVRNLRSVDVGFDTGRLLLASVNPLLNGYNNTRIVNLYTQLLDEVARVPGVRAATLSDPALLSGSVSGTTLFVQGRQPPPRRSENGRGPRNRIHRMIVAPNFFETLGIPLLAGRRLTDRDIEGAPRVVVVNQAAARTFFPHESPIGHRVGETSDTTGEDEIVGMVADVKYNSVRDPAPPTMYVPYRQHMARPNYTRPATFELRTAGDPLDVVPAVREAFRRVDPNLPIFSVSTQEEQIEMRFARERLFAEAYALFGGLAVLVASIGLFGLMSYSVARRTSEIGIRIALGAWRDEVIRMVMGESLVLVLAGIGAGVAVVLAVGRLIASLLYGIAPTDPITMAGAVALMALVSALAGYLPARRASRIDPMVALRHE